MVKLGESTRNDAEIMFHTKRSQWAWIKENGFEDIVRLVADIFHDGKLSEQPRCYKAVQCVSKEKTAQ